MPRLRRTVLTTLLAASTLVIAGAATPTQVLAGARAVERPGADRAAGPVVFGALTSGGPHNFGLNCGLPANQTCEMTSVIEGLTVAHQAAGGPTAPSAGVITSWTLSHDVLRVGGNLAIATSITVALRAIRGAGESGIGVGSSPVVNLPQAAGTYTFPARVPVQAGDLIGYDLTFAPGDITVYGGLVGTAGDVTGFAFPLWPSGAAPAPGHYSASTDPSIGSDAYLPVNATLEPDVDDDGYGDISQDLCPSSATTHGTCPDTSAPRTTITRKPAKKTEKRKAKLGFTSSEAGSTFECKLTGPGLDRATKKFKPCTSVRVYKGLVVGKFEFSVRATDRAGNQDESPATATFQVVRPA